MTRRRTFKWLLPLLAVVLNFGGGPVAWAALVPHGSGAAPASIPAESPAGHRSASSVSDTGHCGVAGEAAAEQGDSRQHGSPAGCCASGACYCGCPAPIVLSFSGARVSYGLADTLVRPAENLLPAPYPGRLLRPPIA